MLSRINQRILTALLTTLLLLLADVTFHAVVYGWLPSATYQAAAAGGDNLLIDSGSSGSLRVDQLSAGAAVAGTDTVAWCQACGSATTLVKATASQIATYVIGVLTAQQNAFVGQQLTPHTLTNASTIAVDASTSNIQTITLSSSGQTMGCPTNVSSGKDATLTFRITQPASAGPDDLNWNSCYWFPTGTPPKQSNGGLSAANGVTDMLTCDVSNVSGTVTSYCPFNGSSNFASSAAFALRGNHTCSDSNCSGTQTECSSSATTCSVTILNSMAGDLRTVEWASFTGASQSAPTGVTDGTNTCTIDTASFENGATGGVSTGFAYCAKIAGSGSATITITWGSAFTNAVVFVQEWTPSTVSPLAGIGNIASGSSGANPSISTNGATTQTGQLVISVFNSGDSPSANACAQVDKETGLGGHNVVQFSTSVSTCSITATSSNYDASITSFLHY